MKITVEQLVFMKTSIQKIGTQDLPITSAFKVAKILKTLNDEYVIFEAQQKKLFEKYGTENIEGNLQIKPENIEIFNQEIQKLLKIELDVNIEKIKLEELKDVKLSGLDVTNLSVLIEEA